ncbi:MAG: ATP-binding protein [Ferruginibacter sp.]|nr:ATP-binding protein [Ferruginibacter sp.]
MEIIGRDDQKAELDNMLLSNKSEFVAVYGRRRVGKTFLIREYLFNNTVFHLTGIANVNTTTQLSNFHKTFLKYHSSKVPQSEPKDWFDAFEILVELVNKSKIKRKVIFIDELPWLDTPKSNFVAALEHFWNSWAGARKDIVLVVCGSAASWMINKLINNRGGLHNRVTSHIKLEPFSLKECEAFFKYKNIIFSRYQIVEIYMCFGGIPYYLDLINKGKSTAQIINDICFAPNGKLKNEFINLYASLFKNKDNYIKIVETLAAKNIGLSREDIIKYSKLSNGGGTTRILNELEESGFIRRYSGFGKASRNSLYQLSDFFSMFYLKFMKKASHTDTRFWINNADSTAYRTWAGFAFEKVCIYHAEQIKAALGIGAVQTQTYAWQTKGAQIDLVMDRRDGIINLFEIKFSINTFLIDKKYDAILRNKTGMFKQVTNTKKAVHLVMITTFGVVSNTYSNGLQNNITLNELFR